MNQRDGSVRLPIVETRRGNRSGVPRRPNQGWGKPCGRCQLTALGHYLARSRTASTMWLELIPAASSNWRGVPEPGIDLTARWTSFRETTLFHPAVVVNASATAEPRPPSGQ